MKQVGNCTPAMVVLRSMLIFSPGRIVKKSVRLCSRKTLPPHYLSVVHQRDARYSARRKPQSSTYRRGYSSLLHSLRPCWTAFLNILCAADSERDTSQGSISTVTQFFDRRLGLLPDTVHQPSIPHVPDVVSRFCRCLAMRHQEHRVAEPLRKCAE